MRFNCSRQDSAFGAIVAHRKLCGVALSLTALFCATLPESMGERSRTPSRPGRRLPRRRRGRVNPATLYSSQIKPLVGLLLNQSLNTSNLITVPIARPGCWWLGCGRGELWPQLASSAVLRRSGGNAGAVLGDGSGGRCRCLMPLGCGWRLLDGFHRSGEHKKRQRGLPPSFVLAS